MLAVTQSTLSGNSAYSGGGISNEGTLTIITSTLSANSAGQGGGIYNISGTVTLNNSTFSGNTAGVGGGIYNTTGGFYHDFPGRVTVNNSTLRGKSASNTQSNEGGGIANGGTLTLNNSTLSGNSAGTDGGGIYNNFMTSLLNVTLSSNSAITGGGLFIVSGYTTVVTNSIIAYSPSGGNCSGGVSASDFSISSDTTCALAGTGDQSNADPLLTALGSYGGPTLVHMLKSASPAIDGVVGIPAFPTDQRGRPRSADGN